VQRLDIVQPAELVVLAPGEEVPNRPIVGHSGVLVAVRRREELQKPQVGVSPASAMVAGTTMAADVGIGRPSGRTGLIGTSSLMPYRVT
jgi:hypothetical protein